MSHLQRRGVSQHCLSPLRHWFKACNSTSLCVLNAHESQSHGCHQCNAKLHHDSISICLWRAWVGAVDSCDQYGFGYQADVVQSTGPTLIELSSRIVNTKEYMFLSFNFVVKGGSCSFIIFTRDLTKRSASVRGWHQMHEWRNTPHCVCWRDHSKGVRCIFAPLGTSPWQPKIVLVALFSGLSLLHLLLCSSE